MTDQKRNPVIIPEGDGPRRNPGCPKCKSENVSGRVIYGSPKFTCLACGNSWEGGRFVTPEDPRKPMPPQNPNDRPLISFNIDKNHNITEVARPAPLAQEFRKGAKVPDPGEDE